MGAEKVETKISFLLLPGNWLLQFFSSLNKHSTDCYNPLVNFQTSEKVFSDLPTSGNVFIAFMEEGIFSAIFGDVTSFFLGVRKVIGLFL